MKLPKGWIWTEIAWLAEINTRSLSMSTPPEYRFRYVDISCVRTGHIDWPNVYTTLSESPSRARRLIAKGDVLMSMVRPNLRSFALVTNDENDVVVSTGFAVLSPKNNCNGAFLFHALFSNNLTAQITRLLTGSNYPAINSSQIADLVIAAPSDIAEQRKIADILSTWDEALEKLDALIAAKERRKKALMQQLLTGKIRAKGYKEKWLIKKFSDVFERVERTITKTPQHVLSITAGKGFVDQRDKFSRVIAGRNIENYVLLRKGEFAYNKGNSDRYPQGCIYRLEEFKEGAVPNVWISFRLKSLTNSSLFYKHFFLAGGHNHQLHRLINAGVRNDGLLNLTPANFFSIRLPVPPEKEQAQLGELFESLTVELQMLRTQREAIDRQKRGLMQRLLTGQIRVIRARGDQNA